MGHWLGTGNKRGGRIGDWLPFEDARKFVATLKLTSDKAWRDYSNSGNRPSNIPATPQHVYKDQGWQHVNHWLGTGKPAMPKRKPQKPREVPRYVPL